MEEFEAKLSKNNRTKKRMAQRENRRRTKKIRNTRQPTKQIECFTTEELPL